MALKKVLLCAVPERRGHATPRRATWGGTRAGREADGATSLQVGFMGKRVRQDRWFKRVRDGTA